MKPRICFVGPMLGTNPGWVPNPMETLAPLLEGRGYKCILTSSRENRYVRFADILRTLVVRRHEFDIICLQVYSGPSFVVEDAVSLLAKTLRKKLVMVLHGGAMPDFMKRNPAWTKTVLGRADFIVTPSGYLAHSVVPHGSNVAIIPNLLPLKDYPYRQRTSVAPRMLWMRTFYEYYNPFMAIDVLKEVQKSFPDAQLTMAGQEKGLLEQTKQYARSLGVEASVRFPGFIKQDAKQREFDAHDIYLNTTRIDNMPICLLEAAAFGLPIVSTNVGGIPYLVTHEESALLVPSDDVRAMADAVVRLVREKCLATKLSRNARQIAERSDWPNVAPMWDNVFAAVSAEESA